MSEGQALKLLISVRDQYEATDALSGGADWLDLKEPAAGPLGAVSVDVAKETVEMVNGRCFVSAAMGELVDWPESFARELLGVTGISVVKMGLRDCATMHNWTARWKEVFSACLNVRKDLAAVIYADSKEVRAPVPSDVLETAIDVGCRYLLIDTYNKKSGSSIELFSADELRRIVERAHSNGITTVLAGNLQPSDFADLSKLAIDVVAIRGGACRAGRTSSIDLSLVMQLRRQLNAAQRTVKELTSSLSSSD